MMEVMLVNLKKGNPTDLEKTMMLMAKLYMKVNTKKVIGMARELFYLMGEENLLVNLKKVNFMKVN